MAYSQTHKDVCEAVESLQWADMDRMAAELVDYFAEGSSDATDRDSMARALHGWATLQLECYAEDAKEKAQGE